MRVLVRIAACCQVRMSAALQSTSKSEAGQTLAGLGRRTPGPSLPPDHLCWDLSRILDLNQSTLPMKLRDWGMLDVPDVR